MSAIRSTDTRPELAVRRLLHRAGLRYRVHHAPLPTMRRRADIVFTRRHIAVFIDGCFWHVCPEHGHPASVNTNYWDPKLRRNVERDRETNAVLIAAGWTVLRYWEHEPAERVASSIIAEVRGGTGMPHGARDTETP